MRLLMIASLLVALPFGATAAPTWQTISSEPGKRIELDRTSLKRDGNTVQAQGRVVLEKELVDGRSGAPYRVIEAVTRYDCTTRSANTIKRIFKKNETDVVREEDIKGADLPVRTGTLDDKVLREVCRPPKEGAAEIAQKANEAAGQLKAANEAMLKKEMAKAEKPEAVKAADAPKEAAAEEAAATEAPAEEAAAEDAATEEAASANARAGQGGCAKASYGLCSHQPGTRAKTEKNTEI